MLSLLAFAANVVAVSPTVPTPWFVFEDYPVDAVRSETEGESEFEVVVAPDGSPLACTITRSTGHRVLDRRACDVAMHRAKFTPARNSAMQPVHGSYRSQIRWALDPDKWVQVGPAPMLQLTLSRMPAGTAAPLFLEYAVEVDSSGRAVQCAPAIPDFPELGRSSCAALIKDLPAMPVATAAGAGVPAVRSVWVAYSL